MDPNSTVMDRTTLDPIPEGIEIGIQVDNLTSDPTKTHETSKLPPSSSVGGSLYEILEPAIVGTCIYLPVSQKLTYR